MDVKDELMKIEGEVAVKVLQEQALTSIGVLGCIERQGDPARSTRKEWEAHFFASRESSEGRC